MARKQNIGDSEDWFVGEDKTLSFEIYSSDEATIQDVTGWATSFVMRQIGEADAIKITKSGSITGTYNADPDTNTQRIEITITDDDTDHLPHGDYQYALKRTTAGSETILAYGIATLKKAAL